MASMRRYVVLAPLPAYLVGVHCGDPSVRGGGQTATRLPGLGGRYHPSVPGPPLNGPATREVIQEP
jgi:hypothetical protein